MENKILKTIRLFSMIEGNDRVLVGLSGGADSVCLLLLLTKLQPVLDILVEAVHVHHGIRGREADEDLLFAKQLCENLNVPFHERHVQVPDYAKNHHLSEEEAARVLRYQVFEDVADSIRANKIAVAHHREDNAETVLLNLCRGSGLTGLSGVPPKRDRIIRPLIEVSRQEIEDYLAEEGVLYRTDGTNLELAYTRNRLRHQVLPLLQNEVNTRAVQHIAEMAMEVREAEAYLTAQARESFATCSCRESNRLSLRIGELKKIPPILQRKVLREALSASGAGLKDITRVHIEAMTELLAGETGRRIDLPGGFLAERIYEFLVIYREEEAVSSGEEAFSEADFTMTVFPYRKGEKIPENRYTKWFDYDKITGMISIRSRQTGDFIRIAPGGRKTIKAFMIDEKIPRAKRDRIPLAAVGNEVLWIVGYRINEQYKVSDDTANILQISYRQRPENTREEGEKR